MTFPDTFKFNSVDVAKYIAGKANERNIYLNITKIQKLLYIAYGVYLRIFEQRLTDEHPEAWPYGPVFPRTREKLLSQDFPTIQAADSPETIKSNSDLNKVIAFTLDNFGTWNAAQLTEWSHREGSPWYFTTQSDGFKWGDRIPDEIIYNYFQQRVTIKSGNDGTE